MSICSTSRLALAAVALVAAAACGRAGAEEAAAAGTTRDRIEPTDPARDSIERVVRARPGYVVDSILPPALALRRFRTGLGAAPAALEGGASSRAALVRAFVAAVEHGDSAALRRMALDRAEFAYLVYPGSLYTRAPYRQAPQIVWYQLAGRSAVGERRLLERLAGRPLDVAGHRCDATPERDGAVRYWRGCRVLMVTAAGDTIPRRLFGVIVERGGRFKFASYANDF